MTYKWEIKSELVWLGQWPVQNSDSYILEQLYQVQNTNAEHLTQSNFVRCCLFSETKCLRDYRDESRPIVRAQAKEQSNYEFIQALMLFGTVFCTLSDHSKHLVPQHVKIIQFLWQFALLDESQCPHFLWFLCKWHIRVCLSWAGFCNIFTEWDDRIQRCWPRFLGLWLWHYFSSSWKGPFHQDSPSQYCVNSLSINTEQ